MLLHYLRIINTRKVAYLFLTTLHRRHVTGMLGGGPIKVSLLIFAITLSTMTAGRWQQQKKLVQRIQRTDHCAKDTVQLYGNETVHIPGVVVAQLPRPESSWLGWTYTGRPLATVETDLEQFVSLRLWLVFDYPLKSTVACRVYAARIM